MHALPFLLLLCQFDNPFGEIEPTPHTPAATRDAIPSVTSQTLRPPPESSPTTAGAEHAQDVRSAPPRRVDRPGCFLFFTAEWCGHCPAIRRQLESSGLPIATYGGGVKAEIYVVDADKWPDVVKRRKVKGLPMLLRFGADWGETGRMGSGDVRAFLGIKPGRKLKSSDLKHIARVGYPLRGNLWSGCQHWSHMTQGEHAGQFDPDWLRSLSWDELQSAHSDAHEGRVKWRYVVRPGRK